MTAPVAVSVAVAVAVAGCATGPRRVVVARGTLAYAVAAAGPDLISIELDERFAVLVRGPDSAAPRLRVDLGPPEADWTALAAADGTAYVGGDLGEVRRLDLVTGAVTARWPSGAPITALAVAGGLLAVGDAGGALCLRRLPDGALLQCAAVADAPITALAVTDPAILTVLSGAVSAWRLPALTRASNARWRPPVWADGEVVVRGPTVAILDAEGRRRTVATMDGAVRSVAVLPGSRLAIAAWIRELDNPSIIVLAPLD